MNIRDERVNGRDQRKSYPVQRRRIVLWAFTANSSIYFNIHGIIIDASYRTSQLSPASLTLSGFLDITSFDTNNNPISSNSKGNRFREVK